MADCKIQEILAHCHYKADAIWVVSCCEQNRR